MSEETQQLEAAYCEMLDQLEGSSTPSSRMTTTTTTTTDNGVTTTTTTTVTTGSTNDSTSLNNGESTAVRATTTASGELPSITAAASIVNDDDNGNREEEEEEEEEETETEEAEADSSPPAINEDAQNELRRQILSIQNDGNISSAEKAKQIQQLMSFGWETARKREQAARRKAAGIEEETDDTSTTLNGRIPDDTPPTQADLRASYHDELRNIYGCKHYQRGVKLKANCCGRWFPCRFCHDDVCDHNIVRRDTKVMMCMRCKLVQPAAQDCSNPECRVRVAHYYCNTCKLWDDNTDRSIYHCDKCGICRLGRGLGHDYFHCEKCNVCMATSLQGRHRCIERNLECDCPICGEYLFTSTSTVIFMRCGHCIHLKCHEQHLRTSYQCPTCLKSLADMTDYFARIDTVLGQQQMPQEYERFVSMVLCNDCERRGYAKFHFLYHKCAHCGSYNTKVLSTLQRDEMDPSIPESTVTTPRYRGADLSGSEQDEEDEDEDIEDEGDEDEDEEEDIEDEEDEEEEDGEEDGEEIEMETSHEPEDESHLTEIEEPELD
ncbi:zinc-ribbon-domain-containing protein [Syncephalis fuscata]|nr:zinc-ribbon-domain-containing protein [Syncephalis fuscata]